MSEGTNPTDGREELKRQLAAGEYRSSVDVILEAVGRILQKLTRRTQPPAPWISALTISLLISLIAVLSSLLTGGMSRQALGTIALGGTLIFLNSLIAKTTFDRAFATLQDKLLDELESSAGLTGIQNWLVAAGDLKRPALVGFLIWVAYVAFINPNPIDSPSPVYIVVMGAPMLFWTGFLLYYMVLFAILTLRLGRCQFKLHTEDPVSTEVLEDWSGMMSFAAYMFAFMLATGTLFTVTIETFSLRALFFVIPRWLPLIALFVVNQIAISGVITRSKRKSLNEVEAQMAALRPGADPPEHEAMETLLWLWDYHDRIKGSRNSTLDIMGIVNLVNTLLIPLLAFLVANREAIFELLGWST
jgi:hypothetical protein